MPEIRDKVLHVYMTEREYKFLEVCAQRLDKSLAQTLLHLADFQTRQQEYEAHPETHNTLGINFNQIPDRDEGEF